MRVAVETSPIFTSRAGVARYVRGLLAGLRSIAPRDTAIAELGWPVENFGYRQPQRALKTFAREWIWAAAVAPRRARNADIVHHTALPIIPFFRPARHVVTLHDVALLRHPERFRSWQRVAGQQRLRKVAEADRVICVSRFTADEAMRLLALPADRIDVVLEGSWMSDTIASRESAPEASLGLPAEYFLFVGSLEPGKNLALLRDVYLAADAVGAPLPPLLIAGARWAGVAHEGAPPAGWRFLGHISDVRLAALYRRARALVFPSRYEGFGLPVVEAMALGCPVICGRVASLPEIGADAVRYVELVPAELGAAMHQVLNDHALHAQLRAAGLERAKAFSWEKCARETLEVYASTTRA